MISSLQSIIPGKTGIIESTVWITRSNAMAQWRIADSIQFCEQFCQCVDTVFHHNVDGDLTRTIKAEQKLVSFIQIQCKRQIPFRWLVSFTFLKCETLNSQQYAVPHINCDGPALCSVHFQ